MPYDNERYPEEEDKNEKKTGKTKSMVNTNVARKKYMFDPQPLEDDESPEWEQ